MGVRTYDCSSMEVSDCIISTTDDCVFYRLRIKFYNPYKYFDFNCFYWFKDIPHDNFAIQDSKYTISHTFTYLRGRLLPLEPTINKYRTALKEFKRLIRKEKLKNINE